jgi:hypothetical protein
MSTIGGFERECDIEERRKKRQEEWEKVRTADEPESECKKIKLSITQLTLFVSLTAAPEEPYDGRSLYERLKEQKDAKDLEFEEARKFKNMIRGLDDDDVDHLTEIDNRKLLDEKRKYDEEQKELNDFRAKQSELQEMSADQKLAFIASTKPKTSSIVQPRVSQKSILTSVVKRKAPTTPTEVPVKVVKVQQPSAYKTIAILPGIGDYKSSDDSDDSSDEEVIEPGDLDLTGRQIRKKKECSE